eukprot:2226523-Rhodomonas_salina.1
MPAWQCHHGRGHILPAHAAPEAPPSHAPSPCITSYRASSFAPPLPTYDHAQLLGRKPKACQGRLYYDEFRVERTGWCSSQLSQAWVLKFKSEPARDLLQDSPTSTSTEPALLSSSSSSTSHALSQVVVVVLLSVSIPGRVLRLQHTQSYSLSRLVPLSQPTSTTLSADE